MSENLKTAEEWLEQPQYAGITVLDHGDWDRKNYDESGNERISEDAFGTISESAQSR